MEKSSRRSAFRKIPSRTASSLFSVSNMHMAEYIVTRVLHFSIIITLIKDLLRIPTGLALGDTFE